MREWGFCGYTQHPISKPTIAAVNGVALGGGTELVLASDLAVASVSARFGLPEVGNGFLAGAGGTFRLPRQIPPKVAMELILTGDPITAARALELGLVNQVVRQADVLDSAFRLAGRITKNHPRAIQASKRTALGMERGTIRSEAADWTLTYREGKALMDSPDALEALTAIAAKRIPAWRRARSEADSDADRSSPA